MKLILTVDAKHCYLLLSLIIPLLSGCGKSNKPTSKIENGDFQNAVWISDNREWPKMDSLMYGDFPAPLFRKEFTAKKKVNSANLFITAAGYYQAYINGKKLGKNILDPAWTNYSKRIYYEVYDLTSAILQGKNCIGVTLGNGFYNPLPMRMWSTLNLRDFLPTGKPLFIAKLRILYEDGEVEEINTDKSWKYAYGPVTRNSIYLGEIYNASKEIEGWNSAGFNDSDWEKSVTCVGPGGRLEKTFFPTVMITGRYKPVAISSPSKNLFIADMGINFTGLYNIRLKGQPGDTVIFRFGERLYNDGTLNPMTSVAGQIKRTKIKSDLTHEATWNSDVFNTDNGAGSPAVAWQTDEYVFGDKAEISYTPQFTFHVFRYLEISGLKYKPDLSDIVGLPFHSDVENINSFSCSSDLIDSIQSATRRTFLDNLISVQSDCPGRERFGYGGDLNATADAFIYNFDMNAFYRKTIYDWIDAMKDSIFIDTAPYVGIKTCGLSWESAFIITQYKLFLYYNDTALIRELYQTDLKWMEKAAIIHPSGIVDKGLADHESLLKVPVELIGTTHYLECSRIMKRFAELMNDKDNENKFNNLAEQLKLSVMDMYFKKPVPDPINRQTLFSTLLFYDIVPESGRKAAADSLLKALKNGPAGHFTTGIFGTGYILEALSAAGHAETVFEVINSKAFPGWGFMIGRGATTIWETWKESDNVYSNCHPMFGSVSAWFYRWLGGIRPDPDNPGFKKFIISPFLPDDLSFVKCSYESPYGTIKSDWIKKREGVQFEIAVPKNSSATFVLPDKSKPFVEIENTDARTTIRKNLKESGYSLVFSEGEYVIKY